jgi:hypothetical protein
VSSAGADQTLPALFFFKRQAFTTEDTEDTEESQNPQKRLRDAGMNNNEQKVGTGVRR